MGGQGGGLIGIFALLFAAGGAAVLTDQQNELALELRAGESQVLERLEAIEGRLGAITGSLPDRMASIEERVLRQNEERADELSRQLTGLASRLEQGDQRLAGMAAELAGIRDGIGARSQSTDLKLVRLGERLNALEDALSDLEQRTIVVEESQRLIAVGATPTRGEIRSPSPVGGAAGATAPAGAAPSWQGLLADLQHQSAGIRLEALYALGNTRDPGTIPHIMRMLDDDDIFVQMTAIGILAEDYQSREAVPRFIDALEHENSAVRETAMIALRELTGREFRFDPSAAPAERSKRVRAWRDWWDRSGESFLQG